MFYSTIDTRTARAIAELVNARLGRRPTPDGPRPGGESTARRDERTEDAGVLRAPGRRRRTTDRSRNRP